MSNSTASPPRPLIKSIFWGLVAGILAGLTMLLIMALLRLLFGWPTPTELIFDRLFPLLTVEFFIGSLVKAGGYTPLKLQGVYGALAGQLAVAGIAGVIYALYLRRKNRGELDGGSPTDSRGWSLIVSGVVGATLLFIALLWATLITNYRGFPPVTARLIASLEMLISFSVCGLSIVFFYGLLDRPGLSRIARQYEAIAAPAVGLRRFLALGIGAVAAVFLSGILRRLFAIGTFRYDGTQYGGPPGGEVQASCQVHQG